MAVPLDLSGPSPSHAGCAGFVLGVVSLCLSVGTNACVARVGTLALSLAVSRRKPRNQTKRGPGIDRSQESRGSVLSSLSCVKATRHTRSMGIPSSGTMETQRDPKERLSTATAVAAAPRRATERDGERKRDGERWKTRSLEEKARERERTDA
ncbi:hypothetical protein PINS_up010975 [Pythium insidiosum]|nr:hypothetical protein PINS_up010975 [Pythium insidiosum]